MCCRMHGNTKIFNPSHDSHRISLVLYQTERKACKTVVSSVAKSLGIPACVLREYKPPKKSSEGVAPTASPPSQDADTPSPDASTPIIIPSSRSGGAPADASGGGSEVVTGEPVTAMRGAGGSAGVSTGV